MGLRNFADDNGVFEWVPIEIKMKCLPGDNCCVETLLGELEHTNQIKRHQFNGRDLGLIRNFKQFQNPKSPKVRYQVDRDPAINAYLNGKNAEIVAADPDLFPKSGELNPDDSGNSSARSVVECSGVDRSVRKKRVIPSDFGISERVAGWAEKNGHVQLEKRLEHFIGKAKASGYTYVDWDEAFMGAIRDDWAKISKTGNGSYPATTQASSDDPRAHGKKVLR